jgi:type II secretory pathway pseudopilin PulG
VRKSQESAPIELVIAVIIMVMSITLAFTVWSNIQTTQCTNQIQGGMMTLENAIVDVSLGSPPTQRVVYLNFPVCGSFNIQAIRFSHYSNPSYCGKCPASSAGCWILEPLSFNIKTGYFTVVTNAAVCVNLPSTVDFYTSGCPYDANINNASGCPPPNTVNGFSPSTDVKSNSEHCGAIYTPSDSNQPPQATYATIGKGSQPDYKLTLLKGYATASNTVEIGLCLQKAGN